MVMESSTTTTTTTTIRTSRPSNKLKAYFRYDGSGRLIPGGPILRSIKPRIGNWLETSASLCCNFTSTTTSTTTINERY